MTYPEITADVDFFCGSTSASYPLVDKARNVTQAYHDVARLIWQSADSWEYDDSNKTDLPIAVTDLVHNQQDYTLPSTAQRIHRIEILDSSSNYQKLDPIDNIDVDIAMSEYNESAGLPLYYDLIGRSVFLYPKPSSAYATTTNGLKVYFDRDVTEFTSGSTTTPGFAPQFHRLLSIGAALDFEKDPSQVNLLLSMKDRMEKGLIKFYGQRMVERRGSIQPKGKKFWRKYT